VPISLESTKKALLKTYLGVCCPEAGRIGADDMAGRSRCQPRSNDTHIRAALAWLLRAQDLGEDAGFCAIYSFAEGWMGSYPETTGYIIPTLLACSR